jgi:hypothetical protein
MNRFLVFCAVLISASVKPAPSNGGAVIDFSRDIQPILSDNCYHCHGPDEKERKAKLRLDTKEGAFRQFDGVAVISAGKSAQSELVRRITTKDMNDVMPPLKSNRNLTAQQIDLLRRWVDQGAPWGKHWAFEVPRRWQLPAVKDRKWARTPLDSFILARLEKEGLKPSPEAPKETLIRRVTLDLTGVPPTIQEVDMFLNDKSASAYERVVDRLLKSPRYGVRMAWDWMDAARYADSSGYSGDPERTMWPWRDWVVSAFNSNMPYDLFTIEQLAGDLLPNATKDQILATGFNRNHMHNGEGGRIGEETRVENVMDRAETTSTLWLGLTMTCCRCHDHKFDPITLKDYYSMYDFFNQTSENGGGRGGQNAPTLDLSTPQEEEKLKQATSVFNAVVKEVEEFELIKFPREKGRPLAESDANQLPGNLSVTLAKREPKQRNVDTLLEAIGYFNGVDKDYTKVLEKLLAAVRVKDAAANNITRVMVMDTIKQPRDTFILVKGSYDKKTDVKVLAATPATLTLESPNAKTEPARETRLDLARWIVSPENPLTARVTVNRYWQTFFGIGLVNTVDDFGVQGGKPSHPELLDWLASEFLRTGWDVKAMHKLIVMSAVYRQSSKNAPLPPDVMKRSGSATLTEHDPENRLLARAPRYRLPSWMIRDVALATSGLLNDTLGGPSVRPYQPEGIWEEATFGKKTYEQDHGDSLYRRSLYIFWRRIVGPTMIFDNAQRQACTVKQFHTNTPLHALTTLNDTTYIEAARAMAERILATGKEDEELVENAFRLATARKPTAPEKRVLTQSLARLRQQYGADKGAAEKLLNVGESKRNEKLDIVEHAACTGLCSLILNLDEAITKE